MERVAIIIYRQLILSEAKERKCMTYQRSLKARSARVRRVLPWAFKQIINEPSFYFFSTS